MSIIGSVGEMIRRYGESVKIADGNNVTKTKVIIQPLMYKNKMYLSGTSLPAGDFDGGHYQMVAPADTDFGDPKRVQIQAKNMTYIIKRLEMVRADNRDLYIWAVLTPYYPPGEDDYAEALRCA